VSDDAENSKMTLNNEPKNWRYLMDKTVT
jgi:hypothetical protein